MKNDESTVKLNAVDGLLNAIRNDPELGPRFKASEALDEQAKRCVHAVDLDIAFSPVLLDGATHTDEATVVAYRGVDGRGVITSPVLRIMSVEEHKLARARFLVARGNEMQPVMDRLFKRK